MLKPIEEAMSTALRVLEKVSPVSSEDLIGVAITAYSSCLMPSSGFVYVCKIEDEVGIPCGRA